jgi:hypothetical protein
MTESSSRSTPPRKQPHKRKVEGGRVTPKGGRSATGSDGANHPAASTRYTPREVNKADLPSPRWVPILMFTLFGLGVLVIFLNYVGWLPGATDNWYTLAGLGLILGGLVTATQYR